MSGFFGIKAKFQKGFFPPFLEKKIKNTKSDQASLILLPSLLPVVFCFDCRVHSHRMADFLVLVTIYIVTFTATGIVFLLGDTDYHRNGIIGKTRQFIVQVILQLGVIGLHYCILVIEL